MRLLRNKENSLPLPSAVSLAKVILCLTLAATCLTSCASLTDASPTTQDEIAGASCIPTGTDHRDGKVTRIVDGDTIKVTIDNKTYTVRYIGIDAPETVKPDTPVEYFG